MIRILIADDHALIREGFKKLIDRNFGMTVAGEVADGLAVLPAIRESEADVLVLDLSMPGKNGLELIKDVHQAAPELKILILTMHPEERFAVRCLKAGARGYLTKAGAPKELIKAIEKVHSGGRYISEKLAEALAFALDDTNKNADHEHLSDREFEVFSLLAAGKNTAAIADKLNIGHSTVNTYRMRIFNKMNFDSIAELVQYAVRHNIID